MPLHPNQRNQQSDQHHRSYPLPTNPARLPSRKTEGPRRLPEVRAVQTDHLGSLPDKEDHMNHPNLSNQINSNIAQSQIEGGVFLKDLRVGSGLEVTTDSRTYIIRKTAPESYAISGHPKFCPTLTPCSISGSTWGGSMLKVGFVGRGMRLEFCTSDFTPITTTTISEISEIP